MTLDEYKAKIQPLLTSETPQPQILVDILDEIGKDLTEKDGLKTQVDALNTTVSTLKDANSKLALRVTETVTGTNTNNEPEPEKTPEQEFNDLVDFIGKEDNDNGGNK